MRTATPTQNGQNRRPNAGRRFKGVQRKPNGQWRGRITVAGRKVSLGTFDTAVEAARAYNVAAKQHFGAYARLNDV